MWRRVASLSPSLVGRGLRIGRTLCTQVSNSVEGGTVLENKTPFITFVLGGPGCGKGTQCAKIAETFGFKHIISADLLKRLILSNTKESSMVRKRIMEGKFAASIETVQLIQKEMESSDKDKFLIDGFPRSEENRIAFEKMVSEPDIVIYLDCTQEEMVERAVNKREGEFVIDEEDTVMKRIELFETYCLAVINYYSKTGKLREIDGDGTVDEVFKRVRAVFAECEVEGEYVLKKKTPFITFVLGGPGSGKGTQCAKIAETFGFTHLSAGELLRRVILSNATESSMIRKTILEGKIVPSEVTVKLIQKEMESSGNCKFLIDGFPRSEENRLAFERAMGAEPDMVLYFECPEEEMVGRILNRNESRDDDNMDTIKKRLKVFEEVSLPVIEHYSKKGKLHKISAVGTVNEIFERVRPIFAKLEAIK